MNNILIIDSNAEFHRLNSMALGPNYSCKSVYNLPDAYNSLSKYSFNAVLLEIKFVDGNGFDLFPKLESFSLNQDVPVIIVTNSDSISDKVHAFSIGADDYITKPFEPLELRARVEARITKKLKKTTSLKLDGLFIEPHFQKVFKPKGGDKVDLQLTPIEFKILFALIESKGRPLSREDLVEKVWDKEHSFESRGIDAHVSNLRKKLGSHSKVVGSVYGVGYVYRPMPSMTGIQVDR